MPTATAAASRIELPPPAWGSPAHKARVRADKEWIGHLRAHAEQDAAKGLTGKQTRYVDEIDILVRYTIPPAAVAGGPSWLDEENDDTLIKLLDAKYEPFFQRTGDLARVSLCTLCQ